MKNILKILSAMIMMISLEALANTTQQCIDSCYSQYMACGVASSSCTTTYKNCYNKC
jgi:hypothetical protein